MQKTRLADSCCGLKAFFFVLCCLFSVTVAHAQTREPYYARKNAFGVLLQYSNDSSHILLGDAEQRKLLNIGVSYNRKLMLSRVVNWQYDGEFFPVALDSDPVEVLTATFNMPNPPLTMTYTSSSPTVLACHPSSGSYSFQNGATETYVSTCTRRWVVGQAMSPAGMQWNFFPRHKNQLLIAAHGGYLYSTQQIPIDEAGSFNFTFDLGIGIETFQSHSRSIRAEFRYHHISNDNTAIRNPGIDNALFHVAYVFGR